MSAVVDSLIKDGRWITGIPISEMSRNHLINSIRYLERIEEQGEIVQPWGTLDPTIDLKPYLMMELERRVQTDSDTLRDLAEEMMAELMKSAITCDPVSESKMNRLRKRAEKLDVRARFSWEGDE